MNHWTRELPATPGIYDHRNLENAGGRAPIKERVMFVGYVNFPEDQKLGHGTKPMPLGSGKLRACRLEHPMTTDSLTVQEWGGEWRRMEYRDGVLYWKVRPVTHFQKPADQAAFNTRFAGKSAGKTSDDDLAGVVQVKAIQKHVRLMLAALGALGKENDRD